MTLCDVTGVNYCKAELSRLQGDKDAQEKFKECDKIVKRMAFEKAIAVDGSSKPLVETVRESLAAIRTFSSKRYL